MKKIFLTFIGIATLFVFSLFASPKQVSAHCDTVDGPVVSAARKALNTKNVNYALIWVLPENEDAIRKALKKAMERRKKAKTKKEEEDADMEFFETLVKVHREGEGAKYEGIKPAGSIEPELAMADKAVEIGKLDEVLNHIDSAENREIIHHLFHKLQEKSNYDVDDVPSGREFIGSYVVFIHAVEKAIRGELVEEMAHHHREH